MLKLQLLLVFIIVFCVLGFTQDTIKHIPSVTITPLKNEKSSVNSLNNQLISKEEIEILQPEDLGVLLQKTAGTSVKSYGGLGGLKTISIRGLNSHHTTFVQDGFMLQNAQTGQVNLGQIMVDNISEIILNEGGKQSFLLPVSAFVNGGLIAINNKNNQFEYRKNRETYFKFGAGSFGQQDYYISSKVEKEKFFISTYAKSRTVKGSYPFKVVNGSSVEEGSRSNNDLKEKHLGLSLGRLLKSKAEIRSITQYQAIDQGLPGAVILYNDFSNQRLSTLQFHQKIDFTHVRSKLYYRVFSSYSHQKLRYVDPSFLNNSGGIDTKYFNDFLDLGLSFQRSFNKIHTYGGLETKYNQLRFSTLNSATPKRFQSLFLFGATSSYQKLKVDVQLSGQGILETNSSGEKANDVYKLNPFIAFDYDLLTKWDFKFKAWYRNSFRMPSFNELYYNNIGNVKLKPEEANQFSLGASFLPFGNKRGLQLFVNVFYSHVKNQILALPTKNLFIWSMQNVGEVENYGMESRLNYRQKIGDDWIFSSTLNYTLQFSLNNAIEDKVNYQNQLAYVSRHTSNIDCSFKYKEIGFSTSALLIGKRYSLNENIISNEVSGYTTLDAGIFFDHKMENKDFIRINFSVKNCLNTQYSYIRYFVMPGRNFLISLSYAFH